MSSQDDFDQPTPPPPSVTFAEPVVHESGPPIMSNEDVFAPISPPPSALHVRPPLPAAVLPQVFACLVACLGSFVAGTAIGWSGPALSIMRDKSFAAREGFVVSDGDANWVASLLPLGALFGGPLAGSMIGCMGRQSTMFLISLVFAISYLFLVSAYSVWSVFVGRLLSGLSCGAISIAAPVYIAETASAEARGKLGSMFQVMITLGIVYADVVGSFGSWRWLSVACLAVVPFWTLGLTLIKESPTYLLGKGKRDEARDSLKFLWRWNPNVDVETELDNLQASLDSSASPASSTFADGCRELFHKRQNLRPLVISLILMVGQQLCGINAVIFFSVEIFDAAGTKLSSSLESIIISMFLVVGTIVAVFVIDRVGRKVLLLTSAAVMVLALIGLGTYFWISDHDPVKAATIGFLPLTSLSFFVFFFSIGFGPIPWLMLGELFSPEIKSKASSISACVNWTLAFLVTQFYRPIADAVGSSVTFWGFAVILLVVLAVCYYFVPETKGKSLEEIQQMFRGEAQEVQEGAERPLVVEEEEEEDEYQ